jgi:hypothetical protein
MPGRVMSDRVMASGAQQLFIPAVWRSYRLDHLLMAGPAGSLRHPSIELSDAYGLIKITHGELERVIEPVERFHEVLGNERVGGVTVVARRGTTVARLHLAIELLFYDVTVRACCRIVGQVRSSFRVHERERAKPDEDSQGRIQEYR